MKGYICYILKSLIFGSHLDNFQRFGPHYFSRCISVKVYQMKNPQYIYNCVFTMTHPIDNSEMPSKLPFSRGVTDDRMRAKANDDSDESTSTLSLLLDELLAPSYIPDFPIPYRVEQLDRRPKVQHVDPTSKLYGAQVIDNEKLSFVPNIQYSHRLKTSLNQDVEVKACKEKAVNNDELLKKWKIKSRQVKQRSKRSLHRNKNRNLDTKNITNTAVEHYSEASFFEWLMAEQKRGDDNGTLVTPTIDNTSTQALVNVNPDDMNLVIRSLSTLDMSPNFLKSLEAFLWEIQRDRPRTGHASQSVNVEDIESTISDITSVTVMLPEYPTLNFLPLKSTDAVLQMSRPLSPFQPEKQKRPCVTTSSTPTPLIPTIKSTYVTFGFVHVRYYERILGDNPSCLSGPSLSIGWRYLPEQTISIEQYERKPSRSKDKLLLPKVVRENILLNLGYTTKDIAYAVRSMVLCRNQRRQTVLNIGVQPFEEALQRVGRRVKRMILTSA